MTNEGATTPPGYTLGRDARVVLHRHGARRTYAVAVVLDEGPYASLADASAALEALQERHGGWVPKHVAAQRLGLSIRQVDYLRQAGRLDAMTTETGHALIGVGSLNAEIARRSGDE